METQPGNFLTESQIPQKQGGGGGFSRNTTDPVHWLLHNSYMGMLTKQDQEDRRRASIGGNPGQNPPPPSVSLLSERARRGRNISRFLMILPILVVIKCQNSPLFRCFEKSD